MEPLLGFEEETILANDQEVSLSPGGYKLVPWLNWDEWEMVRKSLFSSSPDDVAFALKRISTWRSRGCLPVVIDVTASIIEIQQKDPFFRADEPKDALHSEQMLAMLYCMSILRLVNCVVEKKRKHGEISIADAADEIGIPRKLIDVRHEGSHRDLPALVVVRDTSIMALNWLKSYYWEPQKKQIPLQKDRTVNIRREIKSKLCALSLCLKVKQSPQLGSSSDKGKCSRQHAHHCVRNKIFSFMAANVHSSKIKGSKKQTSTILKDLVSLYSSFSSEVVSVLLDLFMKALDSSHLLDLPHDSQADQYLHNYLGDWKPVITKFSRREPELVLALLQRILDMIATKEDMKHEAGRHPTSSESNVETFQLEHLSSLFGWLVGQLKELKPLRPKDCAGSSISSSVLMGLIRKSLLVSASSDNHLLHSSLHLAQLTGDSMLVEKVNKLCSLGLSSTVSCEEKTLLMSSKNLSQQEDSIRQASKKLEMLKLRRMKRKNVKTTDDDDVGNPKRWVVAKSWNPCPIGMLPRSLGISGYLPVLDCNEDSEKIQKPSEGQENVELNRCYTKRKASDDSQLSDDAGLKKAKESDGEALSSANTSGRLMINGVWQKVGEEELHSIASAWKRKRTRATF